MSRTLSKILVVCALVAIFPLTIIGTAFAAYYSIESSVNVAVYTNQISASENAYAKVFFGGKSSEKMTITEGHTQKVELKAVSNGYDFKGWFAGDLQNYVASSEINAVNFLSTESTLNVAMTDYQKLLAVFEIKNYDVSYSYKANPTAEENTTVVPENGKTNYVFGEALPTLTSNIDHYYFAGWKVAGNTENTTFTTAEGWDNFETITLEAVWVEAEHITVNYYSEDGTTLLKTDSTGYQNNVIALDSVDSCNNVNGFTMQNGYKYGWRDENNNIITSVTSDKDVNVYVVKSAIEYKAKLNTTEDATFLGAKEVTFTVEDTSKLSAWFNASNWNKYSYYTLGGVKKDSTTYNSMAALQTVVDATIEANPHSAPATVLEFDAVVTKNFTSFTASAMYWQLKDDSMYEEKVYQVKADGTCDGSTFGSYTDQTFTDTSKTLNETFFLVNRGAAKKISDTDYQEVNIVGIAVTIESDTKWYYDLTGTNTIADLIEMIYTDTDWTINLTEKLSVAEFAAIFA